MTKTRPMTDAQLFELIGGVDPLTADAEPTDLDTEAALRVLLASGPRVDVPPRTGRTGVRHPRRVALRAGVGVAAAGAIAFGVVNVLPDGEPGHIAPASADAVIHQALDAIIPSGGSILHVDISGSQTNADGSTVSWNDESWQQNGAPYDNREIQSGPQGQVGVETATVNGTEQVYDPATNTVYEQQQTTPNYDLTPGSTPGTYELRVAPPEVSDVSGTPRQEQNVQHAAGMFPKAPVTITITSAQAQALEDGTDEVRWSVPATPGELSEPSVAPVAGEIGGPTAQEFRAQAMALMKSPGVQVDTEASIDGRPAIKISSDNGRQVYYVTPDTYQPIELDNTGQGGGSTLRFSVYRELTGAQADATPLSLTARHPSAAVDRSAADYEAAENRLFPNG